MSDRYPGGFITKDTPVTSPTSATGVWTLDQAMQATKAGNWPTNGPFFIEDLFSTWLYTGNGSTQTINNGIDLAGKGGLVWQKARNTTWSNALFDTNRGVASRLVSDSTIAASNTTNGVTAFNSNGFSMGANAFSNNAGDTYASWTFRKQPKFFDVVTWTGNGVDERVIPHSLGSDVGAIIIKRTDTTSNWQFVINAAGSIRVLRLNTTEAAYPTTANMLDNGYASINGFYTPSNTGFALINGSTDFTQVNASGGTYVAYLFAHNAGGFGLSGSDNVISCGSYTTNSSAEANITLGYEPQWLLVKQASGSGGPWYLLDTMRGWSMTADSELFANTSAAETVGAGNIHPTATGFYDPGMIAGSATVIYIAIRRGPMKTPTTGTSVFSPVTQTAAGTVTTGFPVDLAISGSRTVTGSKLSLDRLRGSSTNSYASLFTNSTGAEGTGTGSGFGFDNNTGYVDAFWSSSSMAYWNFRRAPGFFDEVCYTGTGVARTVAHNLAAVPEMMIVKSRNNSPREWGVQIYFLGGDKRLFLNQNVSSATNTLLWNSTLPSSSVFTVGTAATTNESGFNYVAYLFASCPGVSKVGSYTGTGTTQTINCGFTGGARFVLIKRTDSTGDWYVWDTARGMIPANDPYLLLNSTAAEVTGTDFVDTTAVGFEITSTAPAAINASGGTFIYLAIA
jgi:hypothetical protein